MCFTWSDKFFSFFLFSHFLSFIKHWICSCLCWKTLVSDCSITYFSSSCFSCLTHFVLSSLSASSALLSLIVSLACGHWCVLMWMLNPQRGRDAGSSRETMRRRVIKCNSSTRIIDTAEMKTILVLSYSEDYFFNYRLGLRKKWKMYITSL